MLWVWLSTSELPLMYRERLQAWVSNAYPFSTFFNHPLPSFKFLYSLLVEQAHWCVASWDVIWWSPPNFWLPHLYLDQWHWSRSCWVGTPWFVVFSTMHSSLLLGLWTSRQCQIIWWHNIPRRVMFCNWSFQGVLRKCRCWPYTTSNISCA